MISAGACLLSTADNIYVCGGYNNAVLEVFLEGILEVTTCQPPSPSNHHADDSEQPNRQVPLLGQSNPASPQFFVSLLQFIYKRNYLLNTK